MAIDIKLEPLLYRSETWSLADQQGSPHRTIICWYLVHVTIDFLDMPCYAPPSFRLCSHKDIRFFLIFFFAAYTCSSAKIRPARIYSQAYIISAMVLTKLRESDMRIQKTDDVGLWSLDWSTIVLEISGSKNNDLPITLKGEKKRNVIPAGSYFWYLSLDNFIISLQRWLENVDGP